jgi:hypothetical protein
MIPAAGEFFLSRDLKCDVVWNPPERRTQYRSSARFLTRCPPCARHRDGQRSRKPPGQWPMGARRITAVRRFAAGGPHLSAPPARFSY